MRYQRLNKSEALKNTSRVRLEDFDNAVKRVDEGRRSSDWRQTISDARASIISGFGVQSTNRNLAAVGFFAEQASQSHPRSEQAQVALRLCYLAASLAAISLDYVLADQAFRPAHELRQSVIGSIRFGQSDSGAAVPTLGAAINLARKYAENGSAIAKQIEHGFYSEAESIPAEIIADYVVRLSTSDALFNAAREIERASSITELPSYDELSVAARSLLGVFLDFNGVSRERIALAWPRGVTFAANPTEAIRGSADSGPLFEGNQSAPGVAKSEGGERK